MLPVPGVHQMTPGDRAAMREAVLALENPSLAARLTSLLGTPVEKGFERLPAEWHAQLRGASESVMHGALGAAISTLPAEGPLPGDGQHRILSIASGAVGGFFGLPGLLVELPVTTMFMLRSIAATAAREGEDLDTLEARLSCVQVFALGGPSRSDDAAESGYYGLRTMLAAHLAAVSRAAAEKGVASAQLPAVINLVRAIAARFGVVISEKAAFQSLPFLGAAGGALINSIFLDHFQNMARGHFTVRRLERAYGLDTVREAYRFYATAQDAPAANDGLSLAATRVS